MYSAQIFVSLLYYFCIYYFCPSIRLIPKVDIYSIPCMPYWATWKIWININRHVPCLTQVIGAKIRDADWQVFSNNQHKLLQTATSQSTRGLCLDTHDLTEHCKKQAPKGFHNDGSWFIFWRNRLHLHVAFLAIVLRHTILNVAYVLAIRLKHSR